MSRNVMRPALRAGRSILEIPVRTTAAAQSRCFSATSQRQVNPVIFSPTGNHELDAILSEFQKKILLPSYLPLSQRKKLFRQHWKPKLEVEPLEIEVDGTRYQLKHINSAGGEVPNPRKVLFGAMAAMKSSSDWEKLPLLLEGLFYHSRCRFEPGDWPKLIRRASERGALFAAIRSLTHPELTGLKLDRHETVQEMMTAIVRVISQGGGRERTCEKAFRYLRRVMDRLVLEEHQLKGQAKAEFEASGRFPLRKDPQLLATPLLIYGIMGLKHAMARGMEHLYMDKLRSYAEAIVEGWPRGKGLLGLHPDEAYLDELGQKYLMDKNKFLVVAAPILKAFEIFVKGQDPEDPLVQEIDLRRKPLAAEVQAALSSPDLKGTRGKQVYDDVAKWAKLDVEYQDMYTTIARRNADRVRDEEGHESVEELNEELDEVPEKA